jgi:signal transduction histidine kinase
MKIIIMILIIITIIQTFILYKYERQIKDICRQLRFIRENDSNKLITGDFHFGAMAELMDLLNEISEQSKKEKKEYRRKEKMIADTYTNLSHDIRTPLTSLDGYFQLLRDSKDEQDKNRYIGIIQERITSLKEMLEELFTFTKLRNESFKLELSTICVNKILKNTCFSYYDELVKREITPDIRITDKPLYISGNEQALWRVIQNVIKNALDHGEKSLCVILEKENDSVVLEIGNALRKDEHVDVSQVFERFYKSDSARSQTSTGLGLSIAKEFVQKMNGTITARIEGEMFWVEMKFLLV